MQKQIVVIHGGDSYETREKFLDMLKNWKVTKESFLPKADWKSFLQKDLGDGYEILSPRMPNKQNAKYDEWKIWFEKMLPFITDRVILIGHSMGGLFLAKYLSENKSLKKISALFLVAPPYRDTEDIANFPITDDLQKVWEQCQNIHIFQSEDDPLVPMSEAGEYQKAWPGAKMDIFADRGHFNQEDFPELVEEIKKAGK
jgi:predicted alpha/beta hydrolase family esterase